MRKRSRYRPTSIRYDVMGFVMSGMRTLSQTGGALSTLQIKNHDALMALVQGKATAYSMNILIEVSNMSEALTKQGYGSQWATEIAAGKAAIEAVTSRDKWICNSSEMNAIRELFNVHDAQLEVVTVREIEQALDYINDVKRNKLARKIIT